MNQKKSIYLLAITALLLTSCASEDVVEEEVTEPIPTVHVQTVEPGLRRTFEVTGEVEASRKATVDAHAKADIATIAVNVGDTVEAGQVLMKLQSNTADTRMRNAVRSYQTSKQNVAQTKVTNETNVEQAQIAYDTALINLQTLLQENDKKRKQAQEVYDSALVNLDHSVATADTQLQNVLQTRRNTLDNAFAVANRIFEFSDAVRDLSFIKETHIGVRDPTRIEELRTNLHILEQQNHTASMPYAETLDLMERVEIEFEQALGLMEYSVTSAQYTQEELTRDIAELSGALSSISNAILSLRSGKDAVETAIQRTGSLSQTEIAAAAQLESTLQQLDSSEVQARRNIEQANNTLENAKSQATAAEIVARSTLNSVEAEFRNAETELGELVVVAPFDGIVQDIAVIDGDEVQVNQELITIENTDAVTVVANITPEEVRTLSAGSPVQINDSITSTISSISPNADPITKKYTVEIDTDGASLQSGEFVTVEFESLVSANSQRIFVPISSVQIEATDTYVWKVDSPNATSGIATKQTVAIGEIQGRYIEIRTGIEPGMHVITEGARLLTEDNTEVIILQS